MQIFQINVREWHDLFDTMGAPIHYINRETAYRKITEFLRLFVREQLGEGGDPRHMCDLLTGRARVEGVPEEAQSSYITDQVVDDVIAKMRTVEPNLESSLATVLECELSTE